MRKYVRFVGDFETTVYDNQEKTEVWASAVVKVGTEEVKIFTSIDDTFKYLCSLKRDVIIYYHNLKFDGNFWLSYLMCDLKFTQALATVNPPKFCEVEDMPDKSFRYSISYMGQWYSIAIKVGGRVIEIRDSLKLLPLSVKDIGLSFKTKHQKSSIEYHGYRCAGGLISDEERAYIANDVLVVSEALETMFKDGHKGLTIGSCCLSEFKREYSGEYDYYFPNLYNIPLDRDKYGSANAGDYIRRSYTGGWCYLVPEKCSKVYLNGVTADVNSLYPSVMHSESGNKYPIGLPTFWKGDIPAEVKQNDYYYFVRLRTRFTIKPGMLPTIQLKRNLLYPQNEWLKTSDVYDYEMQMYCPRYRLGDKHYEAIPELTLTMTDYEQLKVHYELSDTEIMDGCYFKTEIGIFDIYINKYRKIKEESTGGIRQIAKLYLNNLYGKLSASLCSSFKLAYLKDDGSIGFNEVSEFEKIPGYIAIGSAITSYARNFTILAAQSNFYGADKPGFIYADTDSIHCDLQAEELKNVPIHKTAFLHWKIESEWERGFFVRQKTYIEARDGKIDIKCAGMPERCKELLSCSMGGKEVEPKSKDEANFLKTKRTIADFDRGLVVPGKLIPKRIPGGVVLKETTYEMR